MRQLSKLKVTNKYLLIIILGGLFLRFYNLGVSGTGVFTFDESAQFLIATQDLNNLINSVVYNDFAPPLYHFLLNLWTNLGKTELIARSFSAIAGVLSIPFIYLIGRELYNEKVGLISALLLACSPFNVWASQIARHYSLFVLITLCSVYFFIRILKNRDASKKIWFGFVISTLMLIYTHYYAFLIVITENLLAILFIRNNNNFIKNWILSQISLVILYIPWLSYLFTSFVLIQEYKNPNIIPHVFSIIDIPLIFEYFSIGILHTFNSWKFDPIILILAILIYSVFFVKGLIELRNNQYNGMIILSFLLIPFILSFMAGYKIGFPSPRHLINVSFAFYIIISLALSKIKDRRILVSILVSIVLISAGTTYQNQQYFGSIAKNDLPKISDYINTYSEENDIILISESQAELHIAYYYTGGLKMYGLPKDRNWEFGVDPQNQVNPQNMNLTIRNIQNYTKGYKRFWYINLKLNDMPQLISKIKNDGIKNHFDINDSQSGGDMVKEYLDHNFKLILKNETISEKYKIYLYENINFY